MATYFIQNTNNVEDIEQMNNVIDKVNKVNTEATSNIGQLTDLNNKAQELSNNIQQALPINAELIKNTESAKVTNTNLAAANQEAISKNTELQASLEKTKEFIEGLDGSQNIPQIRMDVTELQNGLKSNQALSYEGSSISADNTLEGRTEGMRIGGRTLVNLKGNVKNRVSTWVDNDDKYTLNLESGHGQPSILYNLTQTLKENQKYTVIVNLIEYTSGALHFSFMNSDGNKLASTTELVAESKGLKKFVFTINNTIKAETLRVLPRNGINNIYSVSKNILILEGDWTNKPIPKYFEGIKSFGEEEKVGDKYKISILSSSKNLFDTSKFEDNTIYYQDTGVKGHLNQYKAIRIKTTPNKSYFFTNPNSGTTVQCVAYKNGVRVSGGYNWRGLLTKDCDEYVFSFLKTEILSNDFQFEEGTQATSYEPYKQDKKDILIKEPLREGDYLYEDNGQVKVYRDVKQYTFTGDENISIRGEVKENTMSFAYAVKNNKSNALLCNNFKVLGGWDKDEERIWLDGTNLMFHIQKSKLSTPDVNGFKAWLKANPTTIVYQLAEPTVEIVENCVDIDLDTFGEKTYFNILNSLPGTLDFKVPSNIASIVQSTAREVNNIWDVINNLLVPSLIDINKNVAMSTIKNNLK